MKTTSSQPRLKLACHGLLDLFVGTWFFFGSTILAWMLYMCLIDNVHWRMNAPWERIVAVTGIGVFLAVFGTLSLALLFRSGALLRVAVTKRRSWDDPDERHSMSLNNEPENAK